MVRRAARRSGGIRDEDLSKFGNPAAGQVNVASAARDLGVAESEIHSAVAQTQAGMTSAFTRAIPRRSGRGGLRGMLQRVFGRGPRGGVVDAKTAAQRLGVAPETVRRWARGSQRPTAEHREAIERSAATAVFRSSPAGKKALRSGDSVWIDGYQGPTDIKYARRRAIRLEPSGADIAAMLDAYEQHGDRGLHEWLTEFAGEHYAPDWEIYTLDGMSIGPR